MSTDWLFVENFFQTQSILPYFLETFNLFTTKKLFVGSKIEAEVSTLLI